MATTSCRLAWIICAASMASGCTHLLPSQSWDQANLKKHDIANCRTANPVFVAPNGNLEQCP